LAVGDIQDLTEKISRLTQEMNNMRSSSKSEREDIKQFYSKMSDIINNPSPAALNKNKDSNIEFFNSGKKKFLLGKKICIASNQDYSHPHTE
jgi:hypothetical protein